MSIFKSKAYKLRKCHRLRIGINNHFANLKAYRVVASSPNDISINLHEMTLFTLCTKACLGKLNSYEDSTPRD